MSSVSTRSFFAFFLTLFIIQNAHAFPKPQKDQQVSSGLDNQKITFIVKQYPYVTGGQRSTQNDKSNTNGAGPDESSGTSTSPSQTSSGGRGGNNQGVTGSDRGKPSGQSGGGSEGGGNNQGASGSNLGKSSGQSGGGSEGGGNNQGASGSNLGKSSRQSGGGNESNQKSVPSGFNPGNMNQNGDQMGQNLPNTGGGNPSGSGGAGSPLPINDVRPATNKGGSSAPGSNTVPPFGESQDGTGNSNDDSSPQPLSSSNSNPQQSPKFDAATQNSANALSTETVQRAQSLVQNPTISLTLQITLKNLEETLTKPSTTVTEKAAILDKCKTLLKKEENKPAIQDSKGSTDIQGLYVIVIQLQELYIGSNTSTPTLSAALDKKSTKKAIETATGNKIPVAQLPSVAAGKAPVERVTGVTGGSASGIQLTDSGVPTSTQPIAGPRVPTANTNNAQSQGDSGLNAAQIPVLQGSQTPAVQVPGSNTKSPNSGQAASATGSSDDSANVISQTGELGGKCPNNSVNGDATGEGNVPGVGTISSTLQSKSKTSLNGCVQQHNSNGLISGNSNEPFNIQGQATAGPKTPIANDPLKPSDQSATGQNTLTGQQISDTSQGSPAPLQNVADQSDSTEQGGEAEVLASGNTNIVGGKGIAECKAGVLSGAGSAKCEQSANVRDQNINGKHVIDTNARVYTTALASKDSASVNENNGMTTSEQLHSNADSHYTEERKQHTEQSNPIKTSPGNTDESQAGDTIQSADTNQDMAKLPAAST